MKKLITRSILVNFICGAILLPMSLATVEKTSTLKKSDLYKLVYKIREELNENLHTKKQVKKSYRYLVGAYKTLTEPEHKIQNQQWAQLLVLDSHSHNFGSLNILSKKSVKKNISLLYSGNTPVTDIVLMYDGAVLLTNSDQERKQAQWQSSAFSVSSTCDFSLLEQECQLSVEFFPQSKTNYEMNLEVHYQAGFEEKVLTLSFMGKGV